MADRLRKAAYVAAIIAAVAVTAAVVGSLAIGAMFIDVLEDELVYERPAEIAEDMRSLDAYAAMYERFPDAVERSYVTPGEVQIEVGVSDTLTGKQLVLWLYATPYSDTYQMSATCWDSEGGVEHDDTAQPTADYIRTTDCMSP